MLVLQRLAVVAVVAVPHQAYLVAPDLDEAIRKLQGQLSGLFGGGKGATGGGGGGGGAGGGAERNPLKVVAVLAVQV